MIATRYRYGNEEKRRTGIRTNNNDKIKDPADPEHSWKIFRKKGRIPCIYVVMDPCDDTLEDPLLGGDGDGVAGN
jgi:hypothetical protein